MIEDGKNSKIKSFLTFRIGEETFAANVSHVLNILEMLKITKVPKAPEYMRGVINLRGSVLPVLDTRLKFGMPKGEITKNTCILVMELKNNNETVTIGAIVDSVQEVLEIEEEDIQAPPSIGTKFKNEYLLGMVKSDDKFVMIIDVEKIFNSEDIVNLQDITNEIKDLPVTE